MKALTVKTLKALKTLNPLKTANLFVSHCFVLTALLSASSHSLAAPLAVAIDDFRLGHHAAFRRRHLAPSLQS